MFRPDPDANPRWNGNLKQYRMGFLNGNFRMLDADGAAAIARQGVLLDGAGLQPSSQGFRVQYDAAGQASVMDVSAAEIRPETVSSRKSVGASASSVATTMFTGLLPPRAGIRAPRPRPRP